MRPSPDRQLRSRQTSWIFAMADEEAWREAAREYHKERERQHTTADITKDDDNKRDESEADEKKREKQADILIRQAKRGAALFHSSDGETWADIEIDGRRRETWAMRSRGFRRWLFLTFTKVTGMAPSTEALQRAITALDASAALEGDRREVHVRVAEEVGIIYLDLCDKDWRAIEISAGGGWRIINKPPVRFRRAPAMLPLGEPEKGGNIELLRKYLNVQSENDFILIVAWLLAALRPRGPYPILELTGEHGSAKTTAAKVPRALVDPNALPVRRPPKDARDLFISAANSHVISLDNLSDISPWLSDALCTLSTDGAFATRTLYTDNEEQLFRAKRPIITNGITNVIEKPDLADRTSFVAMEVISENQRRAEEDFWASFECDRPKILGALLDAVAHGLKALPNIRPASLPRMADFAKWVMACETAFWESGTFTKAYEANRKCSVEDTLAADPIASAVRSFMDGKTEWYGVTKDLLDHLNEIVGERLSKRRDWPQTERGLTNRLKVAVTFLRRVGIAITWDEKRTKRGRPVTITAVPQFDDNPEPPSPPSPGPKKNESLNAFNDLDGDGSSDAYHHQPSPADVNGDGRSAPSPQPSPHNPLKTKAGDGDDYSDGTFGTSKVCDHCGRPDDHQRLRIASDGERTAWLHCRCELPWLHGLGPVGDSLDDL
jgi:hypothetical protein